jgi:hypothetical protein
MFNWLKKLFGSDVSSKPVTPQQKPVTTKQPAAELSKTPTKKTGNKSKAKASSAKTQPAKRGRKKTGVTKTDLNAMNKDQLEAYAKKEYNVDLDKRRKKADLVAEVLKLAT